MLEHIEAALQRPNFIAFVVLFLWGFFIMVAHPNLVKKADRYVPGPDERHLLACHAQREE